MPSPADTDGDGVPDPLDACRESAAGADVDANGCDRDQFCLAAGSAGLLACLEADFEGDEPGINRPMDCAMSGPWFSRRCRAR